MSRFFYFLKQRLPRLDREPIFIDVGSSYTRVEGLKRPLWSGATCLVRHRQTQAVVAIGDRAQALIGRAPSTLEVIFPWQRGVVAEPSAALDFLRAVMTEINQDFSLTRLVFGHTGLIGVPARLSPAEKNTYEKVLHESGLGGVRLVSQVQALQTKLVPNPDLTQSYLLIDIGGQVTQLALLGAGEVVRAELVDWGGVLFTEAIQHQIRQEHACLSGWHEAEKIKLQIGHLVWSDNHASDKSGGKVSVKSSKEKKIGLKDNGVGSKLAGSKLVGSKLTGSKLAVRGKDAITHVAQTKVVSSRLFEPVFHQLFRDLLVEIEEFLAHSPTEVVTNALEHGLYLTGGGSQMPGLEQALGSELKTNVHTSDQPSLDVIQGLVQSYRS